MSFSHKKTSYNYYNGSFLILFFTFFSLQLAYVHIVCKEVVDNVRCMKIHGYNFFYVFCVKLIHISTVIIELITTRFLIAMRRHRFQFTSPSKFSFTSPHKSSIVPLFDYCFYYLTCQFSCAFTFLYFGITGSRISHVSHGS